MRLRGIHVVMLLFLLLAVLCPSVGHAGTSFVLTTNPNPSNPGQAVTLIASGAFSGSAVTFRDGGQNGTVIGTANANGQGTATTSVNSLTSGSHSLVACFFNDFPAFRCTNPVIQIVNTPTNLSLTTSQSPSGLCQAVTFTATITPNTATGTVTFFDGTAQLTTVPVSRGVATFTTSTLALGTHTIQARYNPDPGYNGSSAMIQQTVSGAVTVTLGSSLNPSNSGQPVTFTAAVAAAPARKRPLLPLLPREPSASLTEPPRSVKAISPTERQRLRPRLSR